MLYGLIFKDFKVCMTGFNGIFSGILMPVSLMKEKPKFSVLSIPGQEKQIGSRAAKVYLALLHAELFEAFKHFKQIVFSSKEISQKEIKEKYQKIYKELLLMAQKRDETKRYTSDSRVYKIASLIFS